MIVGQAGDQPFHCGHHLCRHRAHTDAPAGSLRWLQIRQLPQQRQHGAAINGKLYGQVGFIRSGDRHHAFHGQRHGQRQKAPGIVLEHLITQEALLLPLYNDIENRLVDDCFAFSGSVGADQHQALVAGIVFSLVGGQLSQGVNAFSGKHRAIAIVIIVAPV